MNRLLALLTACVLVFSSGTAVAGEEIGNDLSRCSADKGPAVLVNVRGIKEASGRIRVQSYPATPGAWLAKGRWLHRIETRANSGSMSFCVPVSAEGKYGIAVRHDLNANGKTDISSDGGGFSNNPSINIFNLGKPSVSKAAFQVGPGVTRITINLKYM
jgi:uncharacterized protein (DUF2141 family)